MPWTSAGAKKHKKGLTSAQAKKWAKIANAALKSCQNKSGKDCEGYAIRVANSKMSEEPLEEVFGVTKDRKKPGGSNAGKYKKGPFCGPSGGAPKGTYPVNTKGRARAAIAYARHAPNPSGIKSCVYRHWPSLKSKKGGKKMEEKIPKGALRFVETGGDCCALAVSKDGEDPKLDMLVYSGGVVKSHWYWGDLAIDVSGMSFPVKKYPILEEHSRDKKIAFTGKPKVEDNKKLKINSETTRFLNTDAAKEFIENSKLGFPYQSSVYARPSIVEKVQEGETTQVNGMSVKGPISIWRKSVFKEASVCVFGWDSMTSASAFSKEVMEDVELEYIGDENENKLEEEEVITEMKDINELKEKHPELVEELTEEVKTAVTEELTTQFNSEKKKLEDKLAEKETELSDQGERLLNLEKSETIRQEKERMERADKIWDSKLSESDVADHLFDKVKKHVEYTKFVKDDVLDETAFAEAVDAEIKDWETKGATNTILGSSFNERTETGEESEQHMAEKDDEVVKSMQSLVGMVVNE